MEYSLKFSDDVYKMSFEDFKVFVKEKYPKVSVKRIRNIHKNGNDSAISTKAVEDSE